MNIDFTRNVPGPCEDEEAVVLCIIGGEEWKEEERLMLLGWLSDTFPMAITYASGLTMFFICGKDVIQYKAAVNGTGSALRKWSKQELGEKHTYHIKG